MDTGGISMRLVNLARALVGHFRNGLGMVSIVSEIFFSGISGSTAADTAAIGSLLIPAMNQSGYTPPRATAIVCAACGMGILVPPCIAMVVYGGIANVSIGALFAGGFLPAFAMALALMIQLNIQARRAGVPPGKWPGVSNLWPGPLKNPSLPSSCRSLSSVGFWGDLHPYGGGGTGRGLRAA